MRTVHPVIPKLADAHATQRNARTDAPLTDHAFPPQMNAPPSVSTTRFAIQQQANALA